MAAIIIEISNAPGDVTIKRKVEVHQYTKNYIDSIYVIPYTIKHYDNSDQHLSYIPDYHNMLMATNTLRVWIGPGETYSMTFVEGYIEMGMFDFLQLLQKTMTDQAIITAQILRVDSEGRFNDYYVG